MISKNIFDFLNQLSMNNNREWFNGNKAWYNETKAEVELLANVLIQHISNFDSDIQSLSGKDCTFRIFRDVRFSKDKSPYKTNMGVYIVKGGKKSGNGGYYMHLEPENSFVAGGLYNPESSVLKGIRQRIYEHPESFKGIINSKDFLNLFGQLYGEKLKRPPKDFPADFEEVELLKLKSYTVIRYYKDAEIVKEGFLDKAIHDFQVMKPLIQYLNEVRENVGS